MDIFSTLITILSFMFIHPLVFMNMIIHTTLTGHKYTMIMFNFNYDVECEGCGKVFIEEIE